MKASELFDKLLQLRVKSASEFNNVRIDMCVNQHQYIPITAIHLSRERIKIVTSRKYKSMSAIDVIAELNKLLLRKSNSNREVFTTWVGGTEYIPSNVYLNKKGIVIYMQ